MLLTDWFHKPAFELANEAFQASTGIPPVADNGLINGLNVYGNSGKRFSTVFEAGKKHLIRIVKTTSFLFASIALLCGLLTDARIGKYWHGYHVQVQHRRA